MGRGTKRFALITVIIGDATLIPILVIHNVWVYLPPRIGVDPSTFQVLLGL
jgi:hypothetical protein